MPTYDYFPFDSGLGANSTESRWREMMSAMKGTGVVVEGSVMDISIDNMAVSEGSGLNVEIVPGKAWIKGHLFSHTGTNAILPINSNTSGSTRTDLVVLRCDFVNNTMGYQVLQGTTIPVQNANVWDLPLANVTVPDGATSVTVTDRRIFACDASLVPSIRVYRNATVNISSGAYATQSLDSGSYWITDYKMYPTDPSRVYIPQDGFYFFQGMITIGGSASDTAADRRGIRLILNGSSAQTIASWLIPSRTQALELTTSGIWRCSAGDYVQLQAYQTTSPAVSVAVTKAELVCHFLSQQFV